MRAYMMSARSASEDEEGSRSLEEAEEDVLDELSSSVEEDESAAASVLLLLLPVSAPRVRSRPSQSASLDVAPACAWPPERRGADCAAPASAPAPAPRPAPSFSARSAALRSRPSSVRTIHTSSLRYGTSAFGGRGLAPRRRNGTRRSRVWRRSQENLSGTFGREVCAGRTAQAGAPRPP